MIKFLNENCTYWHTKKNIYFRELYFCEFSKIRLEETFIPNGNGPITKAYA